MKFDGTFVITLSRGGRSRKGAWIEICFVNGCAISTRNGRSRKGAWIEIAGLPPSPAAAWVAPVRERGLKFQGVPSCAGKKRGRSRKGAWIEIFTKFGSAPFFKGRSRKGAWIEMFS